MLLEAVYSIGHVDTNYRSFGYHTFGEDSLGKSSTRFVEVHHLAETASCGGASTCNCTQWDGGWNAPEQRGDGPSGPLSKR